MDDFPQTIETRLDKRYWVEQAFADSIVPRALLISTAYDLDSKIPKAGKFDLVNFGYGTFLVENNQVPVKQFCMIVDAYEHR